MLDLDAEFHRIAGALDDAGVAWAVAGAVAVAMYAAPRATQDIDVMLAATDVERAIGAVAPLGFRRAGRPMQVANGRLEIQRLLKFDGADLLPLDILVGRDPDIEALLADRIAAESGGRRVMVVSLRSLRALKRLRGSAQDLADLEALGGESA